jgi:hypothetical protein
MGLIEGDILPRFGCLYHLRGTPGIQFLGDRVKLRSFLGGEDNLTVYDLQLLQVRLSVITDSLYEIGLINFLGDEVP